MLKRLLSKDLKHPDSWLDRWKNRCDVPFKTVSGEGILSKDKLKEIYNADIFSLFLFTQSDKSLDLRFEACVADKKKFLLLEWRQQMQRVIYKTNVVIKKLKCPCCFKGVKNLSVTEIIKKGIQRIIRRMATRNG